MRRARGQALVLGCVLLAVIAVVLVATVDLGSAVHERIRLQNAADAAAYSSAAMEARAFNLYSYANRTQASHYVSAMVLQSYLSLAYFAEAWLTDADGVLRTLSPCAVPPSSPFWSAACSTLVAIPGVGEILAFLRGALALLDALVSSYQQALRESDLDASVGMGRIPALLGANAALAAASTAAMLDALGAVRSSSAEVVAANDARAEVDELGRAAAGLSECLFDRAHVREANGSPLAPLPPRTMEPKARGERDRVARAKRSMAQVANASRFGPLVTARTANAIALPAWLEPLRSMLGGGSKWGQTRLLTHGLAKGWDDPEGGNYIREPEDAPEGPASMLAQGDDLGSDDPYSMTIGPSRVGSFVNPLSCTAEDDPLTCWGEPRLRKRSDRPFRHALKPSIWALNPEEAHGGRGGIHWRVAFQDGYPSGEGWRSPTAKDPMARAIGLNEVSRRIAPGVFVPVYVANVRPIEDGHHPWKGLASFSHFEPGHFAEACTGGGGRSGEASLDRAAGEEDGFNQPSTYVVLSKPTRGAREGKVVAAARAQAYYHRPGNWAEPPSFFNPYWRARLAPLDPRAASAASVAALWSTLPPELLERAPWH